MFFVYTGSPLQTGNLGLEGALKATPASLQDEFSFALDLVWVLLPLAEQFAALQTGVIDIVVSETPRPDLEGFLQYVAEDDGDLFLFEDAFPAATSGDDTVQLGTAGFDIEIDGLRGNDRIVAGSGADDLRGSGGNDTLRANDGRDYLGGGSGRDTLSGGAGADTLKGGNGADRLAGNNGADILRGGGGADLLIGGKGKDTLKGGAGNDTLLGGGGDDVFVFSGRFGDDVINGFAAGGADGQIDLSGVDGIRGLRDLRQNHLSQQGDDAVIHDGSNSITLSGTDMGALTADDFIF
ncbi:calcium-binding protein [Leisingera thetidis]|uniref:calcium-binding protein n=1 Tax=Leisingera thetidis TaxID=2930199 RepID=UPI0021F79638|nr:calcium-binding protein [Leisingera thetidis]